jgi:hypothetical protein
VTSPLCAIGMQDDPYMTGFMRSSRNTGGCMSNAGIERLKTIFIRMHGVPVGKRDFMTHLLPLVRHAAQVAAG